MGGARRKIAVSLFRRRPPLAPLSSLYIHVPFCARRCVYCDFYLTTTRHDTAAFARAVADEMALAATDVVGPIETIYFGGGTPTRLPLRDLATILEAAHATFATSQVEEVTVEANPEDLLGEATPGALRALGVTRLSVGVQSFFDDDLRFMDRVHDGAAAARAVEATAAAFDTFSVDLIFGVPGQPFEHWGANLERALRLGAPHISAYSLTVEPKTVLGKRVGAGLVIPEDDDVLGERFLFTHRYLEERGLTHYEVSSFARPGHHSRHNTRYWTHADVIGLGPGAHSFRRETRSRAWRWANATPLPRWQALVGMRERPLESRERLDADALADEAVLLGLRRLDVGLDVDALADDYGVDLLAEQAPALAALEGAGLLTVTGRRVVLTPEGAAVADAVALKLVG